MRGEEEMSGLKVETEDIKLQLLADNYWPQDPRDRSAVTIWESSKMSEQRSHMGINSFNTYK